MPPNTIIVPSDFNKADVFKPAATCTIFVKSEIFNNCPLVGSPHPSPVPSGFKAKQCLNPTAICVNLSVVTGEAATNKLSSPQNCKVPSDFKTSVKLIV